MYRRTEEPGLVSDEKAYVGFDVHLLMCLGVIWLVLHL